MGLPDKKARVSSENNTGDIERVENDAIKSLSSGAVVIGEVVRSCVGSYDVAVQTGGGQMLHCTIVSRSSYAPFGYCESFLPVEGSTVLVATGSDASGIGYIIGTVPGISDIDELQDSSDDKPQVNVAKQWYTYPYGPSMLSESIYKNLLDDDGSGSSYYGNFRPIDVFPGEYVVMNERGVGIDGDMLTMSIRGGNAALAASAVDDTVRITCRNFKYFGIDGSKTVFNDAGYITSESRISPYLGERTGASGIKRFMDSVEEADDVESEESSEDEEEEEKKPQVGKYRLRSFIGYVGGLISMFLSKPDKNDEETDEPRRTDEKEPIDNGLMQLNINDNGRVMFRSAGGFALERSDRIPVPIRINDHDSPGGVDAADIERKDELKFEIPEDDDGNKSPHYLPLALADKLAFDYRRTYDRFIEHIPSMSEEGSASASSEEGDGEEEGDDFYLRNEQDLDPLTDDAGIPDRKVAPDNLEDATGRRAGIYTLPTGEIIIRDAWGSEIIMGGGNVTVNTPGCIRLNPGLSMITQAGDDIVLKARHSVDVDASENDITIKGDRNVRIAAGSDQTTDAGGVVIESLSASEVLDKGDNGGEDTVSSGVVIKANNSFVSMIGARAIIGAEREVRIATGKGEADREGQLNIAVGSIGAVAEDGVLFASGEGGVAVSEGNIAMIGNSAVIGGTGGVMFAKSGQIGVPIWVDMTADFLDSYTKRFQEYEKTAKDDKMNSPVFLHTWLDEYLFSYRTSEQCNTKTGLELTDTPDHFVEYQPYWSVLAKMKVGTMKDAEVEEWEPHTVDEEYPWPGTDAYDDGKYAMLDDSQATEDETYNQIKVTVEKDKKDGENTEGDNSNGEDNSLDILCSKDFDKVSGDEEADTKMLIKLEDLRKYAVLAVPDDEEGEEEEENK